jgi:hypothetical protein
LKEAIKCNFIPDLFDAELDGIKVTTQRRDDMNSILYFCTNGKYTGGGVIRSHGAVFGNLSFLD